MTKLFFAYLFMLTLLTSAQTQTPLSQFAHPDLQIIRFSWSKQQQGSLGTETGVSAAGTPKSPSDVRAERELETRRQHIPEDKQAIENLEARKRQSQQPARANNQRPPESTRYRYTLEVKNTSAKQITEVAWDYVFTDPKTQQEALRHRFASKAKIKPGGGAKLTVETKDAPYQVVGVKAPSEKRGEQAIIKRIVYADGSVWEG